MFNRLRKDNRGFTLIELIVVIAIIAILAAIAVPAFTGLTQEAEDAARLANAKIVASGMNAYCALNGFDHGVFDEGGAILYNRVSFFNEVASAGFIPAGLPEEYEAQVRILASLNFDKNAGVTVAPE